MSKTNKVMSVHVVKAEPINNSSRANLCATLSKDEFMIYTSFFWYEKGDRESFQYARDYRRFIDSLGLTHCGTKPFRNKSTRYEIEALCDASLGQLLSPLDVKVSDRIIPCKMFFSLRDSTVCVRVKVDRSNLSREEQKKMVKSQRWTPKDTDYQEVKVVKMIPASTFFIC